MSIILAILLFAIYALAFGGSLHLALCSPHDPDVRFAGWGLSLFWLAVGVAVCGGIQ